MKVRGDLGGGGSTPYHRRLSRRCLPGPPWQISRRRRPRRWAPAGGCLSCPVFKRSYQVSICRQSLNDFGAVLWGNLKEEGGHGTVI